MLQAAQKAYHKPIDPGEQTFIGGTERCSNYNTVTAQPLSLQ